MAISRYNTVSFDIFDTLLKRDLFRPTDVFELVEKEYFRRYGIKNAFSKARILSEKVARKKSIYPEITLDEIYDEIQLPEKIGFKELELEIESNVLHCNIGLKAVFDDCIKQGKDVYIISDMYLPKEFLETVLKREGYVGFKDIILSADYRKTKRSGELYRSFLEKYEVNANDVIHIGDSRYGDYIGARKAGIKSIHIKRIVNNTLYLTYPDGKTSFDKRSLYAFINSHVGRYVSRAEQLGFEVLGPILFAYCNWIHDNFEMLTVERKHLWFAARDMYLFKKAYDLLYGKNNSLDYIYISRKSLRPLLTVSTGDVSESGNTFPRGECTVEDVINRMGYTAEDLDGKVDLALRIKPRRLAEYPDLVNALSSASILTKEKEQAEIGMKYLSLHGFVRDSIVLADVGWHGTLQYTLQRILDAKESDKRIIGMYLGCLDGTNERIGRDNYLAYAFDEEKSDSDFAKGILLFESLILAPHGSTVMYRDNGESVEPVLGEPDNTSPFLKSVQAGALSFVREFRESTISNNIVLNSTLSTESFCRLVMEPKKEELDTIGQMDYDDFGIAKLAAPKPLSTYIMHPRQLYHDLKHSPWRIGFMYKLFKIRFPYASIYSFLRKIQGKQT